MSHTVPADSPSRPNVDKVKKDSVALSWTKPVNDGGSKVTDYIVEKKSPGGEFEPVSLEYMFRLKLATLVYNI